MEEVSKGLYVSIALLAGYVFIKTSYYSRFATEHLRTDRFAFHILANAVVFIVIGTAMAELIPPWTIPRLQSVPADLKVLGITAASFNAILAAAIFGILDNFRIFVLMRNDKAVVSVSGTPRYRFFRKQMRMAGVSRYVRKSNDPVLRTLFRALILEKRIMVSLKNRKVYIGDPVFPDIDPSAIFTSLKIIPFASGSRHEATKKVNLSTRYAELNSALKEIPGNIGTEDKTNPFLSTMYVLQESEKIAAPVDIEDIGVVISWGEVESLTLFDEHIYNWFQNQGPPAAPAELAVV